MLTRKQSVEELRKAFKKKNLTLYLGAGVSVANGLPTWNQLILAMYYAAISEERMQGWRPYSNYLYAIAEYQLARSEEPLEIMARKIRKYYPSSEEFLDNLKRTLYQGFMDDSINFYHDVHMYNLLDANPTLRAVQELCLSTVDDPEHGVRSVITYNYDNLLEMVLPDLPHQPIFRSQDKHEQGLPIFHVHGYVPMGDIEGSPGEDIVFTEDQYHQSAQDPYSWRNLVQVQALSRSVGLMVGLSLADRNMRRFLDAVKGSPMQSRNFALLRKARYQDPSDEDLDQIHKNAVAYMDKFERSGMKRDRPVDRALYQRAGVKAGSPDFFTGPGTKGEPHYRREIRGILEVVRGFDQQEQEFVLDDLGITPIWYENYSDIPEIIASIHAK